MTQFDISFQHTHGTGWMDCCLPRALGFFPILHLPHRKRAESERYEAVAILNELGPRKIPLEKVHPL